MPRTKSFSRDARPVGAWLAGAAALAALCMVAPPAVSQTPAAPTPGLADPEVARGGTLYRIHCSSCHGVQGHGDGPVAASLRVRPTDLTTLALRADGKFPQAEVSAAIDGRAKVPAHGASDMPVWGLSFADHDRDTDQEREIAAEVRALVRYLGSIQRR